MEMFPTLGKTTVHIGIANGEYIEVDRLGIKDLSRHSAIQSEVAKLADMPTADDKKKIDKAIEQLQKMAFSVMPKELHDHIKCMGYFELTRLLTVLCTGEDNSENDDPQKKTSYPSQKKKP